MSKITVNKTVTWFAGGKAMSGKIKQIMSDHVVVQASDSNYIVRKSAISGADARNLPKFILAALKKDKGLQAIEIDFNPDGTIKLTWVDPPKGFVAPASGKKKRKPCDTSPNPDNPADDDAAVIKAIDSIWVSGCESATTAWNPEFANEPSQPQQYDVDAPLQKASAPKPVIAPAKPNMSPVVDHKRALDKQPPMNTPGNFPQKKMI